MHVKIYISFMIWWKFSILSVVYMVHRNVPFKRINGLVIASIIINIFTFLFLKHLLKNNLTLSSIVLSLLSLFIYKSARISHYHVLLGCIYK